MGRLGRDDEGLVGSRDHEVREEIRFHLEERAREFREQGMDAEEARRAALETFGDAERVRAEVRRIDDHGMGAGGMMGSMLGDVRVTLRSLRRQPGFAAVMVVTLALGIGASTAIFSVVDAALLRSLPFPDWDRLVFVQGAFMDPAEGPRVRGASYPEASDWREGASSFAELAAWEGESFTLTGEGGAERVQGERVDEGYFRALGADPLVGRLFTPDDHRAPGERSVAVIGEDLWAGRFGSDPEILGRDLEVDGRPVTVVGVLPRTFRGASLQARMWTPLVEAGRDSDILTSRGTRWLGVVARLAPGVGPEEAQADMDAVAARLEAEHPETHLDRVAVVTPLREAYLGDTRTLVLVLFGATGLLLVIAGVNVTNLLLVRASARAPEVLMRRALGAARSRLSRQFVTESLVVAGLGAAAGIPVALAGLRFLSGATPDGVLPPFADVRLSPTAFLFTAAVMTLVGLGAGLAPAVFAARSDVASGLREGRGGSRRLPLQSLLVAGEVGLAVLLLVGAGLMARSLTAQLAVDPGFEAEGAYAFSLQFPRDRYDGEAIRAAGRELRDRLAAHPGVSRATFGSDAPLRDGYSAAFAFRPGRTDRDDAIRVYLHRVVPGYLDVLGIELLRGRGIESVDAEGAEDAMVISRAMAERFFPGEDPVGQSMVLGSPDGPALRVVGVAEDARWRDLTTDIVAGADDPDVYLPWYRFASSAVSMVVRTASGAPPAEQLVRSVVREFDPGLAVIRPAPLGDALRTQTAQGRFGSSLLAAFSGAALLLAAVGLYGVLAFSVRKRKREIAVRMAVGASGGDVQRLVVRQGLVLAGAGVAAGLVTAYFASDALETFLFGVTPVDVPTYGAVALTVGLVALASMWIPAARATRVDPQAALGAE